MTAPIAAQVLVNYGKHIFVERPDGQVVECVARRAAKKAVAGDYVEMGCSPEGDFVVEKILKRQSVFERPDKYGKIKALAANVDQVFITSAIEPAPNAGLIDHYLVACHLFGFAPVILMNKIDLTPNYRAEVDKLMQRYASLGYPVVTICCKREGGLTDLDKQLKQHVSMFVGQSGVGKSSIINQLFPEEDVRTGALSDKSGEGMHTTTATTLYRLPHGGGVIDSPGVREFRISHLTQQNIAAGFKEVAELAPDCKFHNCTHMSEPTCAVKLAVANHTMSQIRYESYRRMVLSAQKK